MLFSFFINLLHTLTCSKICFLDLLHSDIENFMRDNHRGTVYGKILSVLSKIKIFGNNFIANIEENEFYIAEL